MDTKKPKGFGRFDRLMRKLVKVPPDELPPSHGWTCKCGWWNVSCNSCRKCGASIRDAKKQ
jgi:hypothetical protein